MSLLSASGDEVAAYTYDPYGRPVTIKGRVGTTLQTMTDPTHIANRNPLRYRGYYYDNESGFYYLQSRYYDPAICRFINADGYASTGQGFTGFNMFAYCNNSPANSIDPTGHHAIGPAHMYLNDGGAEKAKVIMDDDEQCQALYESLMQRGRLPDPSTGCSNITITISRNGTYTKGKPLKDKVGEGGSLFLDGLGIFGGELIGSTLGAFLSGYGKIKFGIDLVDFIIPDGFELPDGDYESYVVTETWTHRLPSLSIPGEYTYMDIRSTTIYVYCQTYYWGWYPAETVITEYTRR